MPTNPPTDDDLIQLLVSSWVALRAGTLDADRKALLDHERPHWQCEAANLVAEGLLAYVTVELVEPDLAHDREVEPDDNTDAQAFGDRLTAHLQDFVAYRGHLPRVRRLNMH
jgi:hypothetical protein